ncbi:MAG: FadR/GntR family transcriptional regulator [Parvibaculaceae bacterium]
MAVRGIPRRFAETRRGVHARIVEELGSRIVAGVYPPGSALPAEGDYGIQQSVSRTSVREAVKTLSGKGLVESRPKTGTRVRPRQAWNMLDPDVVAWAFGSTGNRGYGHDFYEFRRIFEPQAAALAAERRSAADLERLRKALAAMGAARKGEDWIVPDMQFHQTILEATGNDLLMSLGHLLEPVLGRSFSLMSTDTSRLGVWFSRHEAVYLAIEAADPERASGLMTDLLIGSLDDLDSIFLRQTGTEADRAPLRGSA